MRKFVDLGTYVFIVAGIYLLTTSKNGVGFVKALFGGFANVVQSATGQALSKVG